MSGEQSMQPRYEPQGVEERWQQTWESEGLYDAEPDPSRDYRRSRMTMDEGYVRAVMQFFVHLYERGWIYRANRIINWCPFHETSLSDLEVAHAEVDDALTYVRYRFADRDGHITIATVRPATILADVAVAVHPEDDRYRDVIGRDVIVPFVERRVPVI